MLHFLERTARLFLSNQFSLGFNRYESSGCRVKIRTYPAVTFAANADDTPLLYLGNDDVINQRECAHVRMNGGGSVLLTM